MSSVVTKIKCTRCLGTGIDNNDSAQLNIVCGSCGGTGYVESSISDTTEITDKLDWIKKHIKKIEKKLDIEEE